VQQSQQANLRNNLKVNPACVAYAGVQVQRVPLKLESSPLMTFNGAPNNVQQLVVTATVAGLEPLLPIMRSAEIQGWGYERQNRFLHISGVVNFTLADSTIQGLAPLMVTVPPGNQNETTLNPVVPDLWNTNLIDESSWERSARRAKWACYVRVHNCTFFDTRLVLIGQASDGGSLTLPIVTATGRASMLSLSAPYTVFWPGIISR
jgi:hypothetical protein